MPKLKSPAKAKVPVSMQSIGGKACLKKYGPDFFLMNAIKRWNPKASKSELRRIFTLKKALRKKKRK